MSDVSDIRAEDNILTSIKELLGVGKDESPFDMDIKIHINTALSILTNLGIGPSTGFRVRNGTELWSDFIPADKNLEDVITYVYIKVKLIFDPPLSSAVIASYESMLKELTFYINCEADTLNETRQEV